MPEQRPFIRVAERLFFAGVRMEKTTYVAVAIFLLAGCKSAPHQDNNAVTIRGESSLAWDNQVSEIVNVLAGMPVEWELVTPSAIGKAERVAWSLQHVDVENLASAYKVLIETAKDPLDRTLMKHKTYTLNCMLFDSGSDEASPLVWSGDKLIGSRAGPDSQIFEDTIEKLRYLEGNYRRRVFR